MPLNKLRAAGFDVLAKNHAVAILSHDFPDELEKLVDVLLGLEINVVELISGGGGEAPFTQRLRRNLETIGWPKHTFIVQTIVDGTEREAISHEIDHVYRASQGTIALEIEWNNKDPFYDRDLENFQRLHVQSAVSLGIIITRGSSLQAAFQSRIEKRLNLDAIITEKDLSIYNISDRTSRQREAVKRLTDKQLSFSKAFSQTFVSSKYGKATTHWEKLKVRVDRGVGNPCPLLLIGLPENVLVD